MKTETQAQKQKTNKTAQTVTAKVPFFAQLLADALAGKFGPFAARYYANANSYHKASLTMADVKAIMEQATKGVLAAGSRKGQAVYDLMRSNADKGAVKAK